MDQRGFGGPNRKWWNVMSPALKIKATNCSAFALNGDVVGAWCSLTGKKEVKKKTACTLFYCLKKAFQTHGRSHVERIKSCFFTHFSLEGKTFGRSPLDRRACINCEASCFPQSLVCKCTHCLPGFENPVSHHMSPTCHWLSPRVEGVIRHVLKQFFLQKKVWVKKRAWLKFYTESGDQK